MAKRQNFVVGSTNAVTETMTTSELNHGFDRYEVLTADKLDGTLNSVSDYSNDSSNEIANAIQSITGAQPTGASQSELANALQQMRNEIETTSLTFKGYVATSAPSSSTYALVEGNLWINSATMPTSFPVAASSIKQWNGTSWVNYGSTYTPADFDFFRNINDNEGYYWFGGMWTVMSTDMSTTYFTLNQSTGKWEIKSSVNLPGSPTTTTPDAADQSTKIATTQFVHDFGQRYVTNCVTEIPQDINLELNSGTLTLKSGSKVYLPNGADTFDTPITTSDLTVAVDGGSGQRMVFYRSNGTVIGNVAISACLSGTSVPSSGSAVFYDTSTNKINYYVNGTVADGSDFSLPLAIITLSSGSVVSVDQVFNGFGFIGSTIFALPNVKGLRAYGRNSDGTLKTISWTASSVVVRTFTDTLNNGLTFNGSAFGQGTFHLGEDNYLYNNVNVVQNSTLIGRLDRTSGKINSLTINTVFHAVDYSEAAIKGGTNAFTGRNNFAQAIGAPKVEGFGSDGVRTASVEFIDGGNDNIARLTAVSNNGNNTATADLHFNNGSPYFTVPTSDVVGAAVATAAKEKGQDGYYKFSNGLIIQWMHAKLTTQSATITLPTAFTSGTSYAVVAISFTSGNDAIPVFVSAQTATTVALSRSSGMGSGQEYNIICIGY